MTRVVDGAEGLRALVGTRLGVGDWLLVDQERIDGFARVTGDDQWIHVDPVRAADGPFGTTVAHGWLTASLIPVLVRGIYRVEGVRSAVNYGSDRVRFPAPVPVGSRLRATVDLEELLDVAGGVQLTNLVTVEREGGDRPVCVARVLSRLLT
ncbi:MaoC family dehydratase [Patulibacter sp.]|uniref:MaoC family dehydratase n=1 Tax=Patulibacter sp. TaxID=1912859 RepID=UPI00272183B5|nr:MaoC family dehydratase [Patulibacter sp.]MDO9407804.1 MaoC family dehydratase [Patulibacter sp.]